MKKNKFISVSLVIILLLIIVEITNHNFIINSVNRVINPETNANFEYKCYAVTKNGKYMTLVTFRDLQGINQISYANQDQKDTIINCNGKKAVSIDYAVDNCSNHYYFKTISSNGTQSINDLYLGTIFNDSLLSGLGLINENGIQSIKVTGQNSNKIYEMTSYNVNMIVYNDNLVLDGTTSVPGAILSSNVYSFGDKTTDVGTANTEAANTVVLKVNGNLTINNGVTVTSCVSDGGYGGPKGLIIYCTGNLINNGTISMTARGAKATGQNIYLWKNEDLSYEYIPAVGANGAAGGYQSAGGTTSGGTGGNGINRATGGRRIWTKKLWNRRLRR